MHATARVFLFFSLGYFVSFVFRGLNIGFAVHLTNELGLDASDLGMLTSLYFLGFALTQIPAGAALDTWGPRRVNASLMLIAAVGSLLFGLSYSLGGLMVGRFFVGVGVAVCLGASLQALAQVSSPRHLPFLYGAMVAVGGLGGVVVGTPLTALLKWLPWREVSFAMAALTATAALAIWFGAVDAPMHGKRGRPAVLAQFRGTLEIFSSYRFWKLGLFPGLATGVFYAVQSLWVKPFLLDVNLLALAPTDILVSVLGLATVIGSVGSGILARWLERVGMNLYVFVGLSEVLFVLVQLLIVFDAPIAKSILWSAYGFFGALSILIYIVLANNFPKNMLGRLNTSFTMLLFLFIFFFQIGIGWIVNWWQPLSPGVYPAQAHIVAWSIAIGLQVLSGVWYFWPDKTGRDQPEAA